MNGIPFGVTYAHKQGKHTNMSSTGFDGVGVVNWRRQGSMEVLYWGNHLKWYGLCSKFLGELASLVTAVTEAPG